VERYRPSDVETWNAFVRTSRNGTFLFERGYMDYHADRFVDHSLMIREPEGQLVAILPAHENGDRISSHAGLSYGGLIIGPAMKAPMFLRSLEALLLHLKERFATFDYKTIPHIYHKQPAEEDRYALFLLNAPVVRRDLLSVVSRDDRIPYQSRRARGVKKARSSGITIQREADFAAFWDLLAATLASRHAAAPVHSLDEIHVLHERFRENISLHTARTAQGELLAGVVIYRSDRVAHTQYIASSPEGRDIGALDLLFDELIQSQDCAYFDFGGSHEDAGRVINEGLIDQKEGFGARSITHDHYRIDLRNVQPGVLTGALR
jgi:hypothetical protein